MLNITSKSTKADIIDAAVELTDSQAERIETLEQQLQAVSIILACSIAIQLLF